MRKNGRNWHESLRTATAFALVCVMAWGGMPAPAIAQTADEAMGEETTPTAVTTDPVADVPANQPAEATASDAGIVAPVVGETGEEHAAQVTPQAQSGSGALANEMGEDAAEGEATSIVAASEEALSEAAGTLSVQSSGSVIASGTWGTCPWEITKSGALTVRSGSGESTASCPWSSYAESITSVRLIAESGARVVLPSDSRGLFSGLLKATSMDLSGADTSQVTDMDSMFYGCTALAALDLSSWDTSSVKYAAGMFYDCSRLASLKVGSGYAIKSADMVPDATADNGKWWSRGSRAWYAKGDIVTGRTGISDTYACHADFPDVPADAWYAGMVVRAVDLGLVNGYDNGSFGPDGSITRGQAASILWNMAGEPAPMGMSRAFPDVASDKYYYQPVCWASSVGVVSAYGTDKFGPGDFVTREQLAVMLASYANRVAGIEVSGSADDYASMSDAASVSEWAAPSVGWCFRNQIMSGSNGCANPQGTATRAEVVKMVVCLHDLIS